MAIELLTERHGEQIAGVLGCWDRMLIFGTLPKICFAGGMTSFLFERNIRIFDYPRFAEPFRNRIPTADATVIDRPHRAGAVLVALGALALNDFWFGGQTVNS